MKRKYALDKVFYATLSNGQVETLIQGNEHSVDNVSNGQRVYFKENMKAYDRILSYYKDVRSEDDVRILRLKDYINAFFEAKDLVFSKSSLLHKRYGAVVKAKARALKDEYLDDPDHNHSSGYYLQGYISDLIQEQQVSEKEAVYIGQKIQQIQIKRQDNDKGLNIV